MKNYCQYRCFCGNSCIFFALILNSAYEAVIAENGKTNRFKDAVNGTSLISTQGSHVKCDAYNPFWISWKDRFFQLGTGTVVGYNPILTYNMRTSWSINALSFANGPTSDADWIFSEGEGKLIL